MKDLGSVTNTMGEAEKSLGCIGRSKGKRDTPKSVLRMPGLAYFILQVCALNHTSYPAVPGVRTRTSLEPSPCWPRSCTLGQAVL